MDAETEKELLAQYRRTRSPFKAAKALGLSIEDAWAVIEEHKDNEFEQRHGGAGRPELRPYLVATRGPSERAWNNNDPAVVEARAKYAAGTHTLTTGRDGSVQLLYCIPLRQPSPANKDYFKPETH